MNDPLAQLAAANPVPDESLTPEQQERADALLERLTQPAQKKRRPLLVAAAAVAVLALGVAVIPGLSNNATPQATAEEVLAQAGAASASRADAPALGQEYMKRTDSDGQATVTTEYEVHAGQLRQDTRTEGTSAALADFDPSPRITLAQLADAPSADALRDLAVATYGDAALGSLHLLLHPGLTSAQQKLVYDNLAAAGGNELGSADITAGEDSLVTVYRDADHVNFSVLPSTGQIVEVHGLVAPDVTTRVEATAILGCVAATGLEGPKRFRLPARTTTTSFVTSSGRTGVPPPPARKARPLSTTVTPTARTLASRSCPLPSLCASSRSAATTRSSTPSSTSATRTSLRATRSSTSAATTSL